MWSPDRRADKPSDEESPGAGEVSDEAEGKPSGHGPSADQIEMLEKLAVIALGAIEPVQRLIEVLMHMR